MVIEPVTRDRLSNISSYAQPALKSFRACSASDEIRSSYAQHILNYVFEIGHDFP